MNKQLIKNINEASKVIGKTWPLYAFVTSNPLAGYEKSSFESAIQEATKNLGGSAFPETYMFQQALESGEIDEQVLSAGLAENGFETNPEFHLQQMATVKPTEQKNANHQLDSIMCKWLGVFMDEGSAEWEMPYKTQGFYVAWKKLAKYDKEINTIAKSKIPNSALEALDEVLKAYSEKEQLAIFKHHIAALPGWTGYINYRTESNSAWQQKYPISMVDYLAVRLWIAKHSGAELIPCKSLKLETNNTLKLKHTWLKAWEKTWQNQLSFALKASSFSPKTKKLEQNTPDAQLVFCIDTRSELIRRHIEKVGNYETFGYAGFFGIAMDYQNPDTGLTRKSCPPIVGSAYKVSEVAQKGKTNELENYQHKNENKKFSNYFFKRMKNMLPSAFGYVEGSGLF
ncbi:MAG TPA: putative inorganic carbon transporter subunit DabA, partial [Pelobium sp.]|nr:putative inorganic carbon transporter subunit DabA [Pelobium sp.]